MATKCPLGSILIGEKCAAAIQDWSRPDDLEGKYVKSSMVCTIDNYVGEQPYKTKFITIHDIGGGLSPTIFENCEGAKEFLASIKKLGEPVYTPKKEGAIWIRNEKEYNDGKGSHLRLTKRQVWGKAIFVK